MTARLLDEDFIQKIQGLELVTRKVISGKTKGERRSKRRGYSTEFADHRPYTPGDDLRFLDWNIYGRLDRLFLKLFLEEEDLWVHILLDRSRSMRFGDPDKFDYAKRVAAALAYIALHNFDRVRIGAFSDRLVPVFAPARGRRQIQRLFETLDRLEPDDGGTTDLAAGAKAFVSERRPSGILIFISDFFDRRGFEAALRYLLAGGSGTEVYLLQLLAPQEIEPPLAGDLKLVDCEDGGTAEISISRPLLDRYRRTLDAFRGEVKDFAARRGMHYAFASTALSFDKLVLEYLRRRGLLK
jgi:uncharacterized protein (DUF58 family)